MLQLHQCALLVFLLISPTIQAKPASHAKRDEAKDRARRDYLLRGGLFAWGKDSLGQFWKLISGRQHVDTLSGAGLPWLAPHGLRCKRQNSDCAKEKKLGRTMPLEGDCDTFLGDTNLQEVSLDLRKMALGLKFGPYTELPADKGIDINGKATLTITEKRQFAQAQTPTWFVISAVIAKDAERAELEFTATNPHILLRYFGKDIRVQAAITLDLTASFERSLQKMTSVCPNRRFAFSFKLPQKSKHVQLERLILWQPSAHYTSFIMRPDPSYGIE